MVERLVVNATFDTDFGVKPPVRPKPVEAPVLSLSKGADTFCLPVSKRERSCIGGLIGL